MKLSIIICTHNSGGRLIKTLDSILNQKEDDFEVVVIDGASTDNTLEIIKDYDTKFKGKLHWISEKDKGIYEAMNKGVKIAKGEYINVIGAGDWLEPRALEKTIEFINENHGVDAAHGILRVWDREIKYSYLLQTKPNLLSEQPMQHPALYYKKELHDKFGLYDENYKIAADYDFCIRAFYKGGAKAVKFKVIVDNFVTDGISSINVADCSNETLQIRKKYGFVKRPSAYAKIKRIIKNIYYGKTEK